MYLGDDCPTQVRLPADEELAHRLAARISTHPERRIHQLMKIKQAVNASDYENSLKLSVAVDRLLERIRGGD